MSDLQSTVGVFPRITPPLLRIDEAEFLLKHIEDSLEMRRPYTEIWHEIEDNLLVRPTRIPVAPPWSKYGLSSSNLYFSAPQSRRGYSVLKDPESHQINESLTAQMLQILIGPPDYLTAAPRGMDDPEKGRLLANMLMAVLDQPGVYGTMYRALKDSFGYGISYLQIGWEERARMQMSEVPVFDEVGNPLGMRFEPRPALFRQGPRIDVIDHFDFYPDPNGTRIHGDMEFVAKRFRMSPQQALDMAEAGVYDMEATKRALMKHGDGKPANGAPYHGDERFREMSQMRPASTLLWGFEGYGRVPLPYPDGADNRFITMLNGEIVRSHINPFRDGEIPIVELVVNPMTGRHYGFSPLEAIRFLQDSTDTMLMTLTDAADRMVRPRLLIGNFGGDPDELRRHDLDDHILCRDPSAVAPVPTDFNALQMAQAELIRRKQSMREASGATSPMQAIPSGDRATATEISTLTQLATQRIDVMVRLIERDNMPVIGRLLHSRLRQFVPPGSDLLAVLNGEQLSVPFEAIDVEADIRFGGSRLFASKFQQATQMREFLSVLGSFPTLVMLAPEIIVRYGRDILGIPDAEMVVSNIAQRSAALAEAGMLQGGPPVSESPQGTEAGESEREGAAQS